MSFSFLRGALGGTGEGGDGVPVPEHLDWILWRPIVTEGCSVTLEEIDTHYDLVELWDLNEALDIREEAERRAMPKGV